MAVLPTNYLDDILAASMGGKRRFRITHEDGSTEEVTLEDVSEYEQVGSPFGSGDVNKTNQAVNEKLDSADVVDPALATVLGFAADAKLTGDALSELNKKLTNENWEYAYGDYCMYRVKNGICTVMGVAFGDYGLKKGEYKSISTIKESARPDKKIRFAAAAFSGTACIHGCVDTDGIVYLYTDQDNVNYWMYSVSFPTK